VSARVSSPDEVAAVGEVDLGRARAALASDRAELLGRLRVLRGQFDDIVEATTDVSTDDEHDPEGATIAYERAQVTALSEQARRRLSEVDDAVRRLEEGTYGACQRCGEPIPDARLEARPYARTCVGCAPR